MLKRFLIALAVLLSIVAIIVYYYLGGSEPLNFSLVSNSRFYVVGNYFEGEYNDPKLEKLFFEAQHRAEQQPQAALTIVNYRNDEQNTIIRQFIGSGSRTKPQDIPEHLAVRSFPPHEAIFTIIDAHNMVMPTAEHVLEEANEFASENGYELDSLSLEIYVSERELRISFPVKTSARD